MFKDLKIMHRLGIGFGTLLILMVGLGGIALVQMNQLSDLTGNMYRHPFQVSNAVQRVENNIVRLHNAMKDVALARIPQEIAVAASTMKALEADIESDFATITRLYLGDQTQIRLAMENYRAWLPIRDEITTLMKQGESWRAAEIAKGRGAAHMERITQCMALLNEATQQKTEDFYLHTRDVRRKAFVLMYCALGFAFATGLLFTWVFTRSVTAPVQEILHVSNAIAQGNLNSQITFHADDELGQMAESLRHMLSGVIGEGQSIKQGIPIVFWTADTNLTLTYLNRAATLLIDGLSDTPAQPLVGSRRVDEVMKDEDGLCGIMARKSLLYGTQNDMELYFPDHADMRCLRCVTSQLRDLSGQVVGVMGVGIDITQRIGAEERLRESEARLEEAQHIARLGHWEWDLKRDLGFWSRELCRILGIEPVLHPITREFLKKAIPHSHLQLILGIMRTVLFEGRTVFEERLTLPDGQVRWVVGKGILARNDLGEPVSAFGTVQDITEQKQADENRRALEKELRQSQKLQAIGTLAGGIAHDFNNILAAILGFAELLVEELDHGSTHHQYAHEVLTASQRARDLVKQILNFSRQTDQRLTPVFLRPLINEAVQLLRATIPSTLTIDLTLGEGEDKPVMADPTQIHQIVMNLGTNAAHAMKKQGTRIAIALERGPLPPDVMARHPDLAAGEYQRFTITDEGCGLAPETLERIFDPFFTTKEPGEGTGMGLSVVHGIVTALKGTLTVQSQVGKGTSFAIYLPTVETEHPANHAPPSRDLPRGTEHILLVDDEALILTLCRKALERLGYRITACRDGDEALTCFRKSPHDFHLIVTDMNMPKVNGAQLATEVLTLRPEIPIILLTGYSDQMDDAQAKQIGITRYLHKPLDRTHLAHAVREALDGHRPPRSDGF